MKKSLNNGFMLVETLVVTIFVASILLFLLTQFTNLNNNYNKTYKYNKVEEINSLKNIIYLIQNETDFLSYIDSNVSYNKFLNITDCSAFSEVNYCKKLLKLENIKEVFITTNKVNYDLFNNYDENFKEFINKIQENGKEKYRIIAYFNNSTYATIRLGV